MTVIVAAMGWSWQEADVDPLTGAISASPHDRGPDRADFAALEHALSLAEKWDAQVIAATVGPPEADEMLKDALAAGATGALRVEPAHRSSRPRAAELVGGGQNRPAALAAALRQLYEVPDLVLCGDRSADRGTGSFPAFLAAALNAAQALGVVRLEPEGDGELRVHRRLDGGRREVLRVRCPAVVSVEAAGVRLRRAGLPETLASRRAVIPVIDAPAVAGHRVPVLGAQPYRPRPRELPVPSGTALHRTLQLTGALAEHTPPTVLGPLSPEQAADELLGYLRRRGYLAAGDPG
jgi:electron transfer flavoprotein beta subunit